MDGTKPRRARRIRRHSTQRTHRFWQYVPAVLLVLFELCVLLFALRDVPAPSACAGEPAAREILSEPVPVPAELAGAEKLLSLTLLDVGQGDSLLLIGPNGGSMLVDAGEEESVKAVLAALSAYGIERIDALVATHPHRDHIGGMADVLKRVSVGACYAIDRRGESEEYDRFLFALQKNGCSVTQARAGEEVAFDADVTVRILNPIDGADYADDNDASIVLRVTFGRVSFLLTGDVGEQTERLLIDTYGANALRADVLKLGHHGAGGASSASFLDAVRPSFALASVGKDNDYGHPNPATVSRLKERGIPLFRTDLDGVVTVFTDGRTVVAVP